MMALTPSKFAIKQIHCQKLVNCFYSHTFSRDTCEKGYIGEGRQLVHVKGNPNWRAANNQLGELPNDFPVLGGS